MLVHTNRWMKHVLSVAMCWKWMRWNFLYRPLQMKKCLWTCAKWADSDHPVHAQSITMAFALLLYNLKYPMIRLADRKCPDQTARMRRLIWAFAVCFCPKTHFRIVRLIYHPTWSWWRRIDFDLSVNAYSNCLRLGCFIIVSSKLGWTSQKLMCFPCKLFIFRL